jgi:lipoprotein-anchoring transpeptidase ErfK/SrfK
MRISSLFRLVSLSVLLLLSTGAFAQSLSMVGPVQAELTEGRTYTFSWNGGGLETVNIALEGTCTPLGKVSRGSFSIPLANRIPAAVGEFSFVIPWIDSAQFSVVIKGYDSTGGQVFEDSKSYGFRPAVLADRTLDGIYVDLHLRVNQRLYVQKCGRISKIYICSSSQNYHWLPPNRHIDEPHDHAGIFKVIQKSPLYRSKEFDVDMRWAMRYLSGHFIHATSKRLYRYLGRPASHGCNRLTLFDAQQLYDMTPLGTRVEVIGPAG